MKRLIFGCGYLGRRVADIWCRAGDTVYAVTRSQTHSRAFEKAGFFPMVADILLPVDDYVPRAGAGSGTGLPKPGFKAGLGGTLAAPSEPYLGA